MSTDPQISIVVPMLNERENVAGMVREVHAACDGKFSYELILVDDGSSDGTRDAALALAAETPWLRIISHKRACGQSQAVLTGVRAARAPIIATLDGDLQNPPAEVPRLVAPLMQTGNESIGLVAGQRRKREDTLSKRLASRAANRIRARILDDDTRDTGCGAKAFRREAFLSLPFFDHMHRYLPALMKREGHGVMLLEVEDRQRTAGRSNYTNFGRALVGISDLAGVWWLMRRRSRPEIVE